MDSVLSTSARTGWCVVGWSSSSHSALLKKLASNLAVWPLLISRVLYGLRACKATAYLQPQEKSPSTQLLSLYSWPVTCFVNSPWMREWLSSHRHLRFRLSLIFSGGLKNGCPGGLDRSIRCCDETNDLYKSHLIGLGCSPAKLRAHIMHLHLLNHVLLKTLSLYLFAPRLAQLYITINLDWLIC